MGGVDANPDFVSSAVGTTPVTMFGGAGNDTLTGLREDASTGANYPLVLGGGEGNDVLSVGRSGRDKLQGGVGDDMLRSDNGIGGDSVSGDEGTDDIALIYRGKDSVTGVENGNQIGTLTVAQKRVDTNANSNAELTLRWTHPVAWQRLRKVSVAFSANGTAAGSVTAEHGEQALLHHRRAITLIPGRCTVTRSGRTVTMKIRFHVPATRGRAGPAHPRRRAHADDASRAGSR